MTEKTDVGISHINEYFLHMKIKYGFDYVSHSDNEITFKKPNGDTIILPIIKMNGCRSCNTNVRGQWQALLPVRCSELL